MQVGIKSNVTGSLNPSSLNRGRVSSSSSVGHQQQVKQASRSEFPESPLLSTQPMRYNIQLNHQLTAVQQADSYLSQVEGRLLHLQHAATTKSPKENAAATVKHQAEELLTLLGRRQTVSSGTVDRQLNAVLDGNAKVYFSLRSADAFFQHSEGETLVFSLAGQQREISAVNIRDESSPEQVMRTLNIGLGKFSVHGQFDEQQQPIFSADEKLWPRLSEHLSVRGQGVRYPDGQFFPMKLVAEPTLEESLQEIAAKPAQVRKKLGDIQHSLEQVTTQRRLLIRHKESVQNRIEGMAGFPEPGSAIEASQLLRATLTGANNHYATLMEVTTGQANLNVNTVKNLLA
jgi:hypothetical protein